MIINLKTLVLHETLVAHVISPSDFIYTYDAKVFHIELLANYYCFVLKND